MRANNNPGIAPAFILGGPQDFHAHGGHDLPSPPVINKRVQVRSTDHPRTDRWVSLTTVRTPEGHTYRVGVVDGLGRHVEPTRDYPTPRRARNAANRLLREMENN
jgi:hypothetical protein